MTPPPASATVPDNWLVSPCGQARPAPNTLTRNTTARIGTNLRITTSSSLMRETGVIGPQVMSLANGCQKQLACIAAYRYVKWPVDGRIADSVNS